MPCEWKRNSERDDKWVECGWISDRTGQWCAVPSPMCEQCGGRPEAWPRMPELIQRVLRYRIVKMHSRPTGKYVLRSLDWAIARARDMFGREVAGNWLVQAVEAGMPRGTAEKLARDVLGETSEV